MNLQESIIKLAVAGITIRHDGKLRYHSLNPVDARTLEWLQKNKVVLAKFFAWESPRAGTKIASSAIGMIKDRKRRESLAAVFWLKTNEIDGAHAVLDELDQEDNAGEAA